MAEVRRNKRTILEHEEALASELSMRVLKKPKPTVWMILIPIFLVFFMYQVRRILDARQPFFDNYMKSRKRALDAAAGLVETGGEPDLEVLAKLSDVPEDALPMHIEWIRLMVEHYAALLRATGDDFGTLARSAYSEKTSLMLIYNRLNQAEHAVNEAILPGLEKEIEGVREVTAKIEAETEALRKEDVEVIFG